MSEEPAAFVEWLDEVGLPDWPVVTEPDKQAQLLRELTAASAWEAASQAGLELQLVDVVPSDPAWRSEPLTRQDLRVLSRALRRWTGLPVHISLIVTPVDYEATWGDKVREIGAARVFTPGVWRPTQVDAERPWLTTYAAQYDAAGRRVVVSASGGQVDAGAWVGSTSRPIDDKHAEVYAHELLHALGHQHHYTPALYSPGADRGDGRPYLVSTDCIMASGYTSGMKPLLCPICRYRIHPTHSRGWARRYRRALQADNSDESPSSPAAPHRM